MTQQTADPMTCHTPGLPVSDAMVVTFTGRLLSRRSIATDHGRVHRLLLEGPGGVVPVLVPPGVDPLFDLGTGRRYTVTGGICCDPANPSRCADCGQVLDPSVDALDSATREALEQEIPTPCVILPESGEIHPATADRPLQIDGVHSGEYRRERCRDCVDPAE